VGPRAASEHCVIAFNACDVGAARPVPPLSPHRGGAGGVGPDAASAPRRARPGAFAAAEEKKNLIVCGAASLSRSARSGRQTADSCLDVPQMAGWRETPASTPVTLPLYLLDS
jgi:hypothetical protein